MNDGSSVNVEVVVDAPKPELLPRFKSKGHHWLLDVAANSVVSSRSVATCT